METYRGKLLLYYCVKRKQTVSVPGRACEMNFTTDCLASFTQQNPKEFTEDIVHAAAQQMEMYLPSEA